MAIDAEFWARRRVLITGHTGFKGAWLSLWLQSLGAEVSGLAPGAPTRPSLYELARVGASMSEYSVDVRDLSAVFERELGPRVATARAGNVIGGGDWGQDRLIADVARAIASGDPVRVRNPSAVRPWQHVLNPLSGYLLLAQELSRSAAVARAWNFGPREEEEQTVSWLLERASGPWAHGRGRAAD